MDARKTAVPFRDDPVFCAIFNDGFLGCVVVGVEADL